jgi:UPF0716 protein FxsA
MRTVRRVPGWLVALLFFGVPLIEIVVLIQVGQAIGAWWTILLLVADSVFGAWLIKHEGRRALAALSESLSAGRMPARELADGALTRPLARRGLSHFFAAQLTTGSFGPDVQRPRPDPSGDVIQGEVVDD